MRALVICSFTLCIVRSLALSLLSPLLLCQQPCLHQLNLPACMRTAVDHRCAHMACADLPLSHAVPATCIANLCQTICQLSACLQQDPLWCTGIRWELAAWTAGC